VTNAPNTTAPETRAFPYRTRPFRWEDIPAFVDILNRDSEARGVDERSSETEILEYYTSPEIDPETDVMVVTDAEDNIVAWGEIEVVSAIGRTWSDAAIDPRHWGRGIGSFLIQSTEALIRERLSSRFVEDQPIVVQRHHLTSAANSRRLFEQHGYRHVRSFYRMRIELANIDPTETLSLPDGIEMRAVTPDHYQAIYQAHQEAFQDHWGWESYSYEVWEHYHLKNSMVNTALWRIAWAGDEIAALNINKGYGEEDPTMGWVSTVGTRRAYRKQGIATVLLKESFRAFKAAGFTSAALGVDAASLTGAVELYERAGMRVYKQTDIVAKMLHGDWLSMYPQTT